MRCTLWLSLLLLVVLLHEARVTGCPSRPCRNCGPGARCQGGQCVCRPDFVGRHPDFSCYNPSVSRRCDFMWDPSVSSLSGQRGKFDFLGSTLLVDIETDYDKSPFGTCDFKMWGWTVKKRGKLYLEGLAFEQIITFSNGKTRKVNGLVKGESDGCRYEYATFLWASGRGPFSADLELASPIPSVEAGAGVGAGALLGNLDRCAIRSQRARGHFLVIESPCCGYEFGLRIHHEGYPDRIPGMFFDVFDDHNPVFPPWTIDNAPLCLDTNGTATYDDLVTATSIPDRDAALTYLAITNSQYLEYEGVPGRLRRLKNSLRDCDIPERQEVFDRGHFMFRYPHFINCIAPDNEVYARVLLSLVRYICEQRRGNCLYLNTTIYGNCAGLVGSDPVVDAFLPFTCPPP